MSDLAAERDRPSEPQSRSPQQCEGTAIPEGSAADILLDAVCTAPLTGDPRALVRHFVEALSTALPGCAVGACFVDPADQNAIIEVRLPADAKEEGRDPTRLFPAFAHEVILPLSELEGSTLHVARDGAAFDAGSATLGLAKRAARVLALLLGATFAMNRGSSGHADITRLKAHLMQAEKLASFGQVAAGVVHELANPLTSIVAYADYLERKARANGYPQEDIKRLERIGEAAERILKFSRDLVTYARPTNDVYGAVSLHEIIDQAILFCEHEIVQRKIEIVRGFAKGIPPVRGLSPQLTQVFVNLFTNAAHAMSRHGGRLCVETKLEAEGYVAIRVTDTGVGIPPGIIAQIFDPFFTTKESSEGSGLGLFIVHDILKSHDGTLDAASTPGEGTTFTLRLPVCK